MRRRDALKMIPLTGAAMAGIGTTGMAMETDAVVAKAGEPLALQYLALVKERLEWIRETQSEDLMEGAYAIARTVENGGNCWQEWDSGHTNTDLYPGRNGEPEIFTRGYNPDKVKDGDLFLTRSIRPNYEADLKNKDVFVIGAPSPWSGDALRPELTRDEVRHFQLWPYADVWIDTQATTWGGLLQVPGMTAPVGPITGVDGPVMLWMMLADACRILARRGISLPVKGDEPTVTGERVDWTSFSGWASLNDPLMDNYYDEVMYQISVIGSEMGTIRQIASMAMDAYMKGGKIYCYSKFQSVAGDANTRRSGLSITRGLMDKDGLLWDGQINKEFTGGGKNDCVIMGVLNADDETDLKYLDYFKKKGMKVASLGTRTRAMAEPSGRSVAKETGLHAGRMCDTYGLFAIKGFDQKIAPTSGVLLNQLFWSTMMELIEQFKERTGGNMPGAFHSAALKGGREHYRRWFNLENSK